MRRVAFTLIELLVVTAIIAVLLGLLVPAVQKVRESASRLNCINNLKQVSLALLNHHDVFKQFPAGYTSGVDAMGNDSGPGWGWAARLLPHMEQEALFRTLDFNKPIDNAANALGREAMIKSFLCPSDVGPPKPFAVGPRSANGAMTSTLCMVAPANLVGCFGVGEPGVDGEGVFFRNSAVRIADILDGSSTTFVVGERSFRYAEATWVGAVTGAAHGPTVNSPLPFLESHASNFVLAHTGETYQGPGYPEETNHFSAIHTGGGNFAFADGHVGFLSRNTTYGTYKALSTRAGGETIRNGDY